MTDSDRFDDDNEINRMIQDSAAELYDEIYPFFDDQFLQSSGSTTTANSGSVSLPSDFYKLKGVDVYNSSTGQYEILKKFNWNERTSYQSNGGNVRNFRYRLQGNLLRLEPIPSGAQTLRIWYYPVVPTLDDDTDTFDGINGWEEYIILSVGIKMKMAIEDDVSDWVRMLEQQKMRILKASQSRDLGEPDTLLSDSMDPNMWGIEFYNNIGVFRS